VDGVGAGERAIVGCDEGLRTVREVTFDVGSVSDFWSGPLPTAIVATADQAPSAAFASPFSGGARVKRRARTKAQARWAIISDLHRERSATLSAVVAEDKQAERQSANENRDAARASVPLRTHRLRPQSGLDRVHRERRASQV